MTALTWQKSTFSGGSGSGECLELASAPSGTLHLRESVTPTAALRPTRHALTDLLSSIKRDNE